MADLIKQHSGRVVDNPGDNLLAEFASAVDAVECAVQIQNRLKKENARYVEDKQLQFRIGINIGDVVHDGDRIYGSGVNVASRIEGLSEPGGISISRATFDQIKGKIDLGYKYIGEHKVKNIKGPIRVYNILVEPGTIGKVLGENTLRKKILTFSAITLSSFLFFGVLMIYEMYIRLPSVSIGSETTISKTYPKGPTLAVLPFKNISGTDDQDYFCDGLTENIITGISANPRLSVIAQHSVFSFKNKSVELNHMAEEFGIDYVLIGNAQRSNDRIRINVKLVDAANGKHIWTERFDRELLEIFKIQDEITIEIMQALEVELVEGEQAYFRQRGTRNLDAFMGLLKALSYWRRHNAEENLKARREIEKVIKLDSTYSEAYVLLSMTYLFDIWYRTENPIISFAKASKSVKKALSLNDKSSDAYIALSTLSLLRHQHDNSIAAAKKAVLLNPNGADAYLQLAYSIYQSGKPIEAIEISKTAFRLNPLPPSQYYHIIGHFYRALERYEEAEDAYKKAIQLEPNNIFANIGLTTVYSLTWTNKGSSDLG
jgi:adenylate cyclase